jgi:hypothetical protein
MGQAAVSPDSLDESATTSIASADDLLAQLAGEEIDRLLAESEAERATADERAGGAAPVLAPGAQRVESGNQAVRLIESAGTSSSPAPPLALEVPTPREPPAAPAAPAVVVPAFEEPHESTSDAHAAAERAALSEAAPTPDDRENVLDMAAPLPIYLRPLEWLNAPLASCPERLRETLGKVAIVTLVNAIAVLAYVLMFRRQ